MFNPGFYEDDEIMGGMFPSAMMRRGARGPPRRFDEHYRCYPVAMMPGPERESANHGGKVFLPPSALDKLTRLHITYPMLFEVINGAKERTTHAGVLEFIAEEGKLYLPFWMMQTLYLEPGDLVQIKSTDLPSGQFVKLQAQSTSFLDISDPKAVLENAFRNFACLSKGDVFTFAYNDQVYEMAVLETKPENSQNAISVLETDLEVDFAPPVGYEELKRPSGTSTPRSAHDGLSAGVMVHNAGSMAQAINYASIAPNSTAAAGGAKAVSSNFLLGGHKLNSKRGSKAVTPKASTPVAGASTNPPPVRRTNGPQPLRLPEGKLFFGYDIKPVKKSGAKKDLDESQPTFQGQGQTLRSGTKRKGGENVDPTTNAKDKDNDKNTAESVQWHGHGRTLRNTPK